MASKGYPTWTRDELILALDLYMKYRPKLPPSNQHPDVVEVSKLIHRLSLVPLEDRGERFRNPAGVFRKLSNFQWIDPEASGGSPRYGRRDKEVWDEFASNPSALKAGAALLRACVAESGAAADVLLASESEEFEEGGIRYVLHRVRERDQAATKLRKQVAYAQHGSIPCEVCGFDFGRVYGDIGADFIECHHTIPLSEMQPGHKTKPADLALVCANCHRMLHHSQQVMTIAELRQLIS